jgi:hypothetical protein
MLLSGIGPAQHLHEHGIPVIADRPGVGANLQDHLQLRLIYKVDGITTLNERYHSPLGRASMIAEYALFRRGPLTMAPSQLGLFTRSDPDQDRANLQYHVQPLSLERWGQPLHAFPAFTASVANLRPTSRGTVRLRSRDPAEKPAIKPNYLSTDADRRVAAGAIRLTRRIVAQPALAAFHPAEYLPGAAAADDDEPSLVRAAGDIGTTIFHPVGTAKMGLASDPSMVVDERLRVAGVERLRVIDASVMPTITSGNTNAPTMMIAEKGAALIARRRAASVMNAIARTATLLVDPSAGWTRVEKEPGDAIFLLSGYVAVLALIPALAGFIGASLIGVIVPGGDVVREPIFDGLFSAVLGYAATFVQVLLVALLIDVLAPRFGGQRSFAGALNLAVYSFTPVWLAGIFLLLPGLLFLSFTALYGVYLLTKGLPVVMKSPAENAKLYAAAVAVSRALMVPPPRAKRAIRPPARNARKLTAPAS